MTFWQHHSKVPTHRKFLTRPQSHRSRINKEVSRALFERSVSLSQQIDIGTRHGSPPRGNSQAKLSLHTSILRNFANFEENCMIYWSILLIQDNAYVYQKHSFSKASRINLVAHLWFSSRKYLVFHMRPSAPMTHTPSIDLLFMHSCSRGCRNPCDKAGGEGIRKVTLWPSPAWKQAKMCRVERPAMWTNSSQEGFLHGHEQFSKFRFSLRVLLDQNYLCGYLATLLNQKANSNFLQASNGNPPLSTE